MSKKELIRRLQINCLGLDRIDPLRLLVDDVVAALAQTERTWVGLTDEEIKAFDAWHDNREEEVGWCNPSEIVAYIEAKLKEKNT